MRNEWHLPPQLIFFLHIFLIKVARLAFTLKAVRSKENFLSLSPCYPTFYAGNSHAFKMRSQQSNDQPSVVPDYCWSMRSSPEIEITICQFFPILNAPVCSKLLQIFNLLHNYLSAPCLADLVTRHHRQLMVNNTTIKKLEIVVH